MTGINACADERGVIAAAAMDQRGSLMKAIAKARGDGGQATAADLSEFKTIVTEVLTKYATAILMDPEYGLEAIKHRAPGAGVLLAYEKTGYDATRQGTPARSAGRLERAPTGREWRRRDQDSALLQSVR